MTVNPQKVYALWCSKRYMQTLQTAWQLSPLYSYTSLRRDDMPLQELVVCACREAVTQAAQQDGRAESQQWLAGCLDNFTLPAALVDYYGKGGDSAAGHLSTMIRTYLRCAEVALDRPWTSTTVAQAVLQPIADETGLPLGFLRDLVQELLPEAPGGPQYRPAVDTCTLAVLLVDESRNEGVIADLTLERLPDGTGALYPAPALSFVYGNDAWQQAMQHASLYVKQTFSWQDWDVRWRLVRRDRQPPPLALTGGSLGAALALGLTKLAGGVKELDLQGIGITATVDVRGQLGKIEGEYAKLLAVARERTLPSIHTVVVAEAQRQDVERIDASLLRDDPQAGLRVICAATLKDAAQLLVVEKQTRWREIIDCTQELTRHRDVVGRAWLREEEGSVKVWDAQSGEYMATILASMTSGLLTLDAEGRIETFNVMAETITGVSGVSMRGQPAQRVFADNVQFLQVLETSRQHRAPLTAPHVDFCRPDGQHVPLALRTAMLQERAGCDGGLLAIFEDLSLIQTLERRLHRADRLAALGQMAAGVAHEIKNPLASIRTFAQLVSRKHHDSRFVEKFDRIVPQELDRITFIVEELLELARPARLHCTPVVLPALLQRVVEIYSERLQQQNIRLKMDWAAFLPPVLADVEQLHRSFANIVLNAIEAMPTGGELTLLCRPVPKALIDFTTPGNGGTSHDVSGAPTVALDLYATDMEVVFKDTGMGIPTAQLDEVFTPFWTTKPKGTGLGLALTHKIIEDHCGTIHLTSEVGHGTIVTVRLPSAPADPVSSAQIL